MVTITTCAACVDPDGVTTFALASPSGSISLIQLLPPREQGESAVMRACMARGTLLNHLVSPMLGLSGLPTRTVLRETSIMTKLLSSFLPVVGRGGGGATSEDAPVSILLHVFECQPVVIALCADLNLRLWSVQVCCDLVTFVPLDLCASLAAGPMCDDSQFVSVHLMFQC